MYFPDTDSLSLHHAAGVMALTSTYPPWCGVPVRVIIPLLRTLVASPLTVVILSGVDGRHAIEVSVGSVEPSVPLPDTTVKVVVVVLMHAILQVRVAVKVVTLGRVGGYGAAERTEKT